VAAQSRRLRPGASAGRRRQRRSEDRDQPDGNEIDGEIEAAALGECEHVRSELPDQRPLDLAARLTAIDQPANEVALIVGLGRLGDAERDAAGDAHHLHLKLGQRRAGRGGGGGLNATE